MMVMNNSSEEKRWIEREVGRRITETCEECRRPAGDGRRRCISRCTSAWPMSGCTRARRQGDSLDGQPRRGRTPAGSGGVTRSTSQDVQHFRRFAVVTDRGFAAGAAVAAQRACFRTVGSR